MPAMWQRIVRIYYYLAYALTLFLSAISLQHALHVLLLRFGLSDLDSVADFLDALGNLPAFSNIPFMAVIIALGILHRYLIHNDTKNDAKANNGAIRAIFLTSLSAAIGLRVIFALIAVATAINTIAQPHFAVADPLAATIAWTLTLGVILVDWAFTPKFQEVGRVIAMVFAYIGQWVLVGTTIWMAAQLAQSLLQAKVALLPYCLTNPTILAQCTSIPPPVNASLIVLVALAGLLLYVRWVHLYQNNKVLKKPDKVLRNLDIIVGMLIVGGTLTAFSVDAIRFELDHITNQDYARFPESLLTTLPDTIPGLMSYPFVGPLIIGCLALTVYFVRQWRRPIPQNGDGMEVAYVTLAPLAALTFFIGAISIVTNVLFVLILQLEVTRDDWVWGGMFVIPGIIGWGCLLYILHFIALGNSASGPRTSGRVYIAMFWITTSLVTIIFALIGILLVVAMLLGTDIDPANIVRAFSVALVTGIFAGYYTWLRRQKDSFS